jgi:cardiolipin synthase
MPIPKNELSQVRIRRNDWVNRKNEISATYREILKTAKSEVTILCSYFLPGKSMRRQIVRAVKRGVTVRVIAAGVSDVVVAKNAERWLYDWLLRNKIELYEYKKTVLHGKTATCDDQWMTIGSYNVNNLSSHASIELNLDIKNSSFTKKMNQKLQHIINHDCVRITEENAIKTRNPFRQLMRWCAYHLLRVALFLFTFYFKQRG